MADQMEARPRKIGDSRLLTLHLLHVILAEFAQTQRVRLADGLRTEDLRDRQQLNRCRVAPPPRAASFDALPHAREPVRQSCVVVERHRLLRYKLSLATALDPIETESWIRTDARGRSCWSRQIAGLRLTRANFLIFRAGAKDIFRSTTRVTWSFIR